MSYDVIFVFPVSVVATVVALVALATMMDRPSEGLGRLRAALFVVPIVAVGMLALHAMFSTSVLERGGRAGRSGWDLHVFDADALWTQSESAASYLPWLVVPFFVCVAAFLVRWLITRRFRHVSVMFAMLVVVAIPISVVSARYLHPIFTEPPRESRERSWGYVHEWLESGAPLENGGVCMQVAEFVGSPRENERGAELALANERCKEYCRIEQTRRRWNPGAMEEICEHRFR